MKCFACLIQSNRAHHLCDESDVIFILYNLLKNRSSDVNADDLTMMTIEYAVVALHNCLLSTRSKWRSQELWDLPLYLLKHAHSKVNDRLQMHCLQVKNQFFFSK